MRKMGVRAGGGNVLYKGETEGERERIREIQAVLQVDSE